MSRSIRGGLGVALVAAALSLTAACSGGGAEVTEAPPPTTQEDGGGTPDVAPSDPDTTEQAGGPTTQVETESTVEPTSEAGVEPATDPTSEPEPTPTYQTSGPGGAPYGGVTAEFDDAVLSGDVLITVTRPQVFTPDPSAAGGGDHEEYVRFVLRLDSTTDQPVDLGQIVVGVESGGGAGTMLIDSTQDIQGEPMGELEPFALEELVFGFGVDDREDVYVHVERRDGSEETIRFEPAF